MAAKLLFLLNTAKITWAKDGSYDTRHLECTVKCLSLAEHLLIE